LRVGPDEGPRGSRAAHRASTGPTTWHADTPNQKAQILGDTTAPQLPPINAESQKFQEWLDTVERDRLRLSGRQVTILLDLFEVAEDVLTRASNILEQGELIPSAKESAPQRDAQPSVEESQSSH